MLTRLPHGWRINLRHEFAPHHSEHGAGENECGTEHEKENEEEEDDAVVVRVMVVVVNFNLYGIKKKKYY